MLQFTRGQLAGMDLEDVARVSALPIRGRCTQPVEVTARRMGIAASTLYGLLDGEVVRAPLTLNRAADLVRATEDYLLAHAFAVQCGGQFLEPVVETIHSERSVARALARVSQEHADVLRVFAEATDPDGDGGGAVTGVELRAFDAEVAKLISALGGLRVAMSAEIAADTAPPVAVVREKF